MQKCVILCLGVLSEGFSFKRAIVEPLGLFEGPFSQDSDGWLAHMRLTSLAHTMHPESFIILSVGIHLYNKTKI